MTDSYTIYHDWCIATGRVPPTREWWDWACTPRSRIEPKSKLVRDIERFQDEIDRERAEGWTYDQ